MKFWQTKKKCQNEIESDEKSGRFNRWTKDLYPKNTFLEFQLHHQNQILPAFFFIIPFRSQFSMFSKTNEIKFLFSFFGCGHFFFSLSLLWYRFHCRNILWMTDPLNIFLNTCIKWTKSYCLRMPLLWCILNSDAELKWQQHIIINIRFNCLVCHDKKSASFAFWTRDEQYTPLNWSDWN